MVFWLIIADRKPSQNIVTGIVLSYPSGPCRLMGPSWAVATWGLMQLWLDNVRLEASENLRQQHTGQSECWDWSHTGMAVFAFPC